MANPAQTEPTEKPVDSSQSQQEFKYYPDDFGKLPVVVEHFNLFLDIYDDHTIAESDLTAAMLEPTLQILSLNAKNLEILEIALYEKIRAKGDHNKEIPKKQLQYTYDKENDKLYITLPRAIKQGERFTLFTKTITRPTKNVLEGFYYDETPAGAPPTQITQCQQWGFQRLVPCFDDMTAKCTYTTTIIADDRYTNVISNGNVAPEFRNGECPVKKAVGKNRSMLRYNNHTTPMAPYLFFLGVGTYATFRRELEYPNGKTFMLELLVPPNAEQAEAEQALDVLSHGILWIHLHTGSHTYEAPETKKKIWELIKKRDALKEHEKNGDKEAKEALEKIRKELQLLVKPLTLGYMYTGDVYREIGMQNSNFGGMENVGNTTIVTNRIMPFRQITDESFEYMMEVKAHEFYHNLNGSEVTSIDPFVLWLNEAVTVHIESAYLSYVMGELYTRITRVMTLHAPMFGTFAEDSSPAALPIIPSGFNTPDELITGMTYIKAPEFVQMIETLMGKETFVKALALYHERFKHKNARTEDWLTAMEEVSGLKFKEMADGWLTRTGFPKVYVTTEYNNNTCTFTLHAEQKGFDEKGPWQFPFIFCLVDKKGKDIPGTETLHWMKKEQETITIPVKEEPGNVSLNRRHALYGNVFYPQQTMAQRMLQACTDSDIVNRYMAFSEILDQEKVRLIKNINEEVSLGLLSMYGRILLDSTLMPEVKALFLAITESTRDETGSHKYKEIYAAKEKLRRTVAKTYKKELLALYKKLAEKKFSGTYIEQQIAGMKTRDLKNLCLWLLASFDDEKAWELVRQQLHTATHASDTNTAMALYLNSKAPDKMKQLQEFKKEAERHLVSWENFLRIVGSNNGDDAIALIKETEKDSHFRIEQSTDQRGLYLSFAQNRKKSILTEEGLAYFIEIIITISKVNEYTGFHFLSAFTDLEKLDAADQVRLVHALHIVRDNISKKEQPSVYNNIQRILKGCPKAVAEWKSTR